VSFFDPEAAIPGTLSYEAYYEGPLEVHSYDDLAQLLEQLVHEVAYQAACTVRPPPPRPVFAGMGGTSVGWSQPPHPIDVIPSFDPRASKADQARMVLYDYYHDDPLRYWSDNEAVKRCFGVKLKEDHDPTALIQAYENPNAPVWSCHGTGMKWSDLDKAVQQAIAHRSKLGPLPKSSYDVSKGPVVIYYYDNDKMKRISYPPLSIPHALNPNEVWWWKWDAGPQDEASKDKGLSGVHTVETSDPKKIALERKHPGWVTRAQAEEIRKKEAPWLSMHYAGDWPGTAAHWDSEGFTWDKDMIGVMGAVVGSILAIVSAVLDATGVGAVVGVPLGIATPFIVATINAVDAGLHAGDFGAAMKSLGPALIQASMSAATKGVAASGINIPPAAMKALGGAVNTIAADVAKGQAKKLDYGEIWSEVAKKAQSYPKLGDDEAHAIAVMLGGADKSGKTAQIFVHGYEAGKLSDPQSIAAIAKVMQSMATFGDPRIINLFLLGAGIGYLAKAQGVKPRIIPVGAGAGGPAEAASGDFGSVGQVILPVDPHADLAMFVETVLKPRYGIGGAHLGHPLLRSSAEGTAVGLATDYAVGFSCPEGYALIATDHQIGCAYRRRADCLGGVVSEGRFVCTDWDYPPCPPGMERFPGSPKNWCLPVAPYSVQGGYPGCADCGDELPHVGGEPDWSYPALGCEHGQWRDPLSGACKPLPPPPPPPSPVPPPHPPHSWPHAISWHEPDYSEFFFPG